VKRENTARRVYPAKHVGNLGSKANPKPTFPFTSPSFIWFLNGGDEPSPKFIRSHSIYDRKELHSAPRQELAE